jgi:hypothetical protein
MPSSQIRFSRLVDLIEKRLPPEQHAQLIKQVDADPNATAELARLARVLELMRAERVEDPPAHVVPHFVGLFQARQARQSPSIRQQIRAVLQFDSRRQSPALGLRSGWPAGWQLLFRAGEHDLSVRVTPAGVRQWRVVGQLLSPCTGGQVELRDSVLTLRTPLSEQCEFVFPPIPTGNYTLTMHLPQADIVLAELAIPAAGF